MTEVRTGGYQIYKERDDYRAGLEAIADTDLTVPHDYRQLTTLLVVIARMTLEGRFKAT